MTDPCGPTSKSISTRPAYNFVVTPAPDSRDHRSDEQILEHLVALNAERVAEEAQGHIRWLRPEFQAPQCAQTTMAGMEVSRPTICDNHEEVGIPPSPPAPKAKTQWPQTLPDQIAALAAALKPTPQSEDDLAAHFAGRGKWKARLTELLATLATLGRAQAGRRAVDGVR